MFVHFIGTPTEFDIDREDMQHYGVKLEYRGAKKLHQCRVTLFDPMHQSHAARRLKDCARRLVIEQRNLQNMHGVLELFHV